MAELIDPAEFIPLPKLDAAAACSLGRMLLMLAPKNAGTKARAGLEVLHERLEVLDEAWVAQAEIGECQESCRMKVDYAALFSSVRGVA